MERIELPKRLQAVQPRPGHTLTPIHARVAHHLAFEHLNCMRQRLERVGTAKDMILVEELSSHDTVVTVDGVSYLWTNEIYYMSKGVFLQIQEIRCSYFRGSYSKRRERFQSCRHHSLTVSAPIFGEEDGLCLCHGD